MSTTDDNFRQELMAMSRPVLNRLNMANYTRNQRRLIDEERCRRRDMGPEPIPTSNHSVDQLLGRLSLNDPAVGGPQPPQANTSRNNGYSNSGSSGRPKRSPKKYYLFEKYHNRICQEVEGVTFQQSNRKGDAEKNTNLIGEFSCSNEACETQWDSGVIATVIRRYRQPSGQMGYNAQVYNQRCRACKSLGIMQLDEEIYVERVARRLKIWKGVYTPKRLHSIKLTKPHKSHLCEGCKAGICPETQDQE
ncbi:hypothetical protein AA313_de0202909 [Arthrobotrys entomopaga]|nr:hypothetical protein AA313_de0202909 [Arthrobotrys entomopaga]